MKKLQLCIIIILSFAVQGWGQEKFVPNKGDIIIFDTYTKHENTDELKKEPENKNSIKDKDNQKQIILEPNIKFRIVEKTETGDFKIIALPFSPLKCSWLRKTFIGCAEEKYDQIPYYNNQIFEVDKDEFLTNAVMAEKIERLSIGILTLPFKFRPQDEKSFEAQFNLNSTLNYMISNNLFGSETKFSLQLGAGLGSVNLNETNTTGSISSNEDVDASTLSMFGGVMLQYDKVQAGIYAGVDHINNQNYYQWKNNGNIWFSIGIGYQLFNVDLGGAGKNKQ